MLGSSTTFILLPNSIHAACISSFTFWKSYGFESFVVDNVNDLQDALKKAVNAKELTLIEVKIPNGFSQFV